MKNNLSDYLLSNSKVVVPSKKIGIVAIGAYVPEHMLKNEEFTRCTPPPGFEPAFGIEERRLGMGETGAEMAVKAAKKALADFSIAPEEIDLVLTTNSYKDPEYLTPPMAAYVQTNVGAVNASAFSVDCGFNGFLPTLTTAMAYIESGHYKTVLVVAGESLMDNVDYNDFKAMTIGDGAGAVVLREVEEGGISAYHHMSVQAEKAAGVRMKEGNGHASERMYQIKPYLKVEPISLERDVPLLEKYIPASIKEILEKTETDIQTINIYIFGQQFRALTNSWMNNLGVDASKNYDTLREYAAVKTASIPLNLEKAYREGELKKGDVVALGDQGANWYISSATLTWSI